MFAIGDDKWPGISKLLEEMGEVAQVCGKLMGSRGDIQHWDGTNLYDRLHEELGDLMAAINFVGRRCKLDQKRVEQRMDAKLALFDQWHEAEKAKAK